MTLMSQTNSLVSLSTKIKKCRAVR